MQRIRRSGGAAVIVASLAITAVSAVVVAAAAGALPMKACQLITANVGEWRGGVLVADNVSNENRLLAALAYPIWIIAVVIVVTDMKKDPFLRHHGWTALFWGIAWIVLWFGLQLFLHVPLLGWLIFLFTAPIFWLVWLVLSIYYAIQVYNGRTFTIPIVSDFAKKYAAA